MKTTELDNQRIKIDEEDLDLLKKHDWKFYKTGKTNEAKRYFVVMVPKDNKTVSSITLHREIAKRKYKSLDFDWRDGTYSDKNGKIKLIRISFKDGDTTNLTRNNLVNGVSHWEFYTPDQRRQVIKNLVKARKLKKKKDNNSNSQLPIEFKPTYSDTLIKGKKNLYLGLLQTPTNKLSEDDVNLMLSLSKDPDIQKILANAMK